MREDVRRAVRTAFVRIAFAFGYIFLLCVLELPCPIRGITGVPCPCCGMLRAVRAASSLRLTDAFGHHPLFPAGLIAFLVFAFDDFLPRRFKTVALSVLSALLFGNWLLHFSA